MVLAAVAVAVVLVLRWQTLATEAMVRFPQVVVGAVVARLALVMASAAMAATEATG